MIDYGSDISPRDIRAYWSNGLVFLKDTGGDYRPYTLISTEDRDVEGNYTIVLDNVVSPKFGQWRTSEPVVLTSEDFFKLVLLHRPELGVVEHKGAIYQLGWSATSGDICKAIRPNDLLCRKLHSDENPSGKSFADELESLAEFVKRAPQVAINFNELVGYYIEDSVTTASTTLLANGDSPFRADRDMRYLIPCYLNAQPRTLHAAADMCVTLHKASTVRESIWVKPHTATSVIVMSGDLIVGTYDIEERAIAESVDGDELDKNTAHIRQFIIRNILSMED